MGAMLNGMVAHGGFRVFGATFFVFSDYLRPAIRLAALQRLPVVFVFTHDSIGLGEDGPTHQPIEHLASLRAIPGLRVVRPADANETAQAWAQALDHHGPTALVLSRQGLPVLPPDLIDITGGAAVLRAGDDAVIVGTGSEVEIALRAADHLASEGISAAPSSPCRPGRCSANRTKPPATGFSGQASRRCRSKRVPRSWRDLVDEAIGLDRFGASAPANVLYQEFGITAEAVADRVRHRLRQSKATSDRP